MNDITPICPICGTETDTVYENIRSNEIVGCCNCLNSLDAYEWAEEEEQNARDLADEQNGERLRYGW